MPKTPRINLEDLVGARGFGHIRKPRYRDRRTGEWRVAAFWHVEYTHNGRKRSVSSKSTNYADAVKLRNQIFTDLWQGRLPWVERREPALQDLLALVVAHYANRGNRSGKRLDLSIRSMLRFPGFDRGAVRARTVTEDLVDRFKAWRRALPKGNAPATINRELAVLRQAYRIGTRRLDEEGRPLVERAPRIEFLREPPPPARYGEEHEFEALHAELLAGHDNTSPQDVADLALFYYLTGWRNSEPRSLRWEWVNWFRKTVTLLDSKSGEPDEYPFGQDRDLEELLRRRRRTTDEVERRTGAAVPWIFHRDGAPIRTFRRAWLAACARAGIPTTGARRLTPHHFRKTRTREVLAATGDPYLTASLLRWKSIAMVKRYRVMDERDRRDAVAAAAALRAKRRAEREELPKVGGEDGD